MLRRLVQPDRSHFWITESYQFDPDLAKELMPKAMLIKLGPPVIHIDNDVLRYGGYVPGQYGYRRVFVEDGYDAYRYVRPWALWCCHIIGHRLWALYHTVLGRVRMYLGMPSRLTGLPRRRTR